MYDRQQLAYNSFICVINIQHINTAVLWQISPTLNYLRVLWAKWNQLSFHLQCLFSPHCHLPCFVFFILVFSFFFGFCFFICFRKMLWSIIFEPGKIHAIQNLQFVCYNVIKPRHIQHNLYYDHIILFSLFQKKTKRKTTRKETRLNRIE